MLRFSDFSFTCLVVDMEMTLVVNRTIVSWNHGFQWQSEIFGKEKKAKQNHCGLNGLCIASIMCIVPIFPLKKRMLDFEKVQRTAQRRATKVLSNSVLEADCKEYLRKNMSRTYTIMSSMELVKMYWVLIYFLNPLDIKWK